MFWAQVVLPLIVGLAVISWQNVQALESVAILKVNNSTRPGNKTVFEAPSLADNFLYTYFACRDKQNGLRLPVAGSCVDYYECHQGVAERLTCSPGKHFSNHGLACLDARLSSCKAEQLDVICEGPCCGKSDGLYPAEDSCSDFNICVNGLSFRRSCGRLLHFSADNLVCDIPERSRCSAVIDKDIIDEAEVSVSKAVMYTVSHRVCQNHPNGYFAPILGSCNKFYVCVNGVGYLKSCGKLPFNAATHYCDSRIRMYCPETDKTDVILDIEYAEIDPMPMPLPRPHGTQLRPFKPIPLDLDGDEELEENEVAPYVPPHRRPQNGKEPKPVHIEKEDLDEDVTGVYVPPHRRPQNGKKPRPVHIEEENLDEDVTGVYVPPHRRPQNGKKPKPVHIEEEDLDEDVTGVYVPPHRRPQNGKKPKPVHIEEEDLDEDVTGVYGPPHRRPQNGKKPIPEEDTVNQGPHSGKRPRPVVVEEEREENEEDVASWPIWGKKPVQRPPNPEEVHEKPQNGKREPIPPQQGGQNQPRPSHPKPNPPHVEAPEEVEDAEDIVVLANSNICSDQPVGALMAMPGDCSKYIRCRWDWYQRRVAELLTCPLDMHFNAKSKYCDWPENAGCIAESKDTKDINTRKNKFTKDFKNILIN